MSGEMGGGADDEARAAASPAMRTLSPLKLLARLTRVDHKGHAAIAGGTDDADVGGGDGGASHWIIPADGSMQPQHRPPAAHQPLSSFAADAAAAAAASASPCAGFEGWDAEEQLSAQWGSPTHSFCSGGSGGGDNGNGRSYWGRHAAVSRPASAGVDVGCECEPPGIFGAGGLALHRRPASAPGQYIRYTVRGQAIQQLEEQTEEEGERGEEAHGELEDEPSAPPLPDQPWGADEASTDEYWSGGCLQQCSPPKAVRFAAEEGGAGDAHTRPSWGAASAAASAAAAAAASAAATAGIFARLAAPQHSSNSCDAPAGGDGSGGAAPSREVSEETCRYQALLATLDARRRAAATASTCASTSTPSGSMTSGSAGAGHAGCWPAAGAASTAHNVATAMVSSSGVWQDSPLLQPPASRPAADPGATATRQHRQPPASLGARWPGMQTYLGNLRRVAAVPCPCPSLSTAAPALAFWEQPVTEDAEAVGAAAAVLDGQTFFGSSADIWAGLPPPPDQACGCTEARMAREQQYNSLTSHPPALPALGSPAPAAGPLAGTGGSRSSCSKRWSPPKSLQRLSVDVAAPQPPPPGLSGTFSPLGGAQPAVIHNIHAMYASEEQPEGAGPTAFRIAEKTFQLHKEQRFSNRQGRRRSKGFVVRPLNLDDVLDVHTDIQLPGATCHGVPSGMPPAAAAFSFAAHPGLLLVRGALAPALQRQLVVDALTLVPNPPNHTNHVKAYPGGLPGLWEAAQQGLRLREAAAPAADAAATAPPSPAAGAAAAQQAAQPKAKRPPVWGADGGGPTAESLLRRLRWAALGPPYDWTLRQYLRDAPHTPLPAPLRQLAISLAALAAQLAQGRSDAAEQCADAQRSGALEQQAQQQQQLAGFCPDAALLNYYYEGDTLNGHLDDAENSLQQPLVSLSLGCPAIFLVGTTSKADPPTALLLRSGDAVVLGGPARLCYHGVPRVLAAGEAGPQTAEALRCCEEDGSGGGVDGGMCGCGCSFAPFARHMQRCRINISVRDTR